MPLYLVGTIDFEAQMCDIKFWKGDENLRPVYKNPFSEILSGWAYNEMKPFFLEQVEWCIKIPSIYINFKNVYLILGKSAPKNVLLKNRIFRNFGKFFIGK